ncbi:MAG TPA: carboxypeptidase regulatory-like domain-containing protein [Bryobacteraceae bacterium]|nr:carboxypeptidase regulatory-like domain-containing protein [Bryobacteraceae bacterium]
MPLLSAQGTANASITGRVVDDSGAPIPEIRIAVTSPALQVSQVTAVTDADGSYRLLDLPAPGVYKATFSRDGFQTYLRGDINLSVGFVARIDVTMKVGQVSQTVEVTGESPVVDTVNTAAGTTLEQAEIALTPKGVGLQDLFPMAAGVSLAGKPDVGDSNLAARSSIITYGVLLEPALEIEGINITSSHDLDTGVYFDSYSLAEAEFKTVSNNADVGFPGVHMVATMKSGSNTFHGSVLGDWETSSLQASNVSPALAALGVKFTNPIKTYFDYAGDLGGRLIRDKLWFYGGISNQKVIQGQLGFVSGPNAAGCWTCLDAPQANLVTALPQENLKLSYQVNQTTRLIGVWQHAQKFLNAQGASSTQPFPSTQFEHQPEDLYKGEIQMAPGPHVLIDALAGYGGYHVHYLTQPGTDVAGNPSSQEQSTKLFTGPYYMPTDKPQNRYQAKANVTYIFGAHQLKVGTDVTFEEGDSQVLADKASGDYLLLFNKGLPTQVQLFNYPITPVNKLNTQAVYATDTWKLGRVVLNYGLRWERYYDFYPTQNKLAGQFSPAATFPGQDLLTWKDFAPRVGSAWDIFGNGKTVIKGSFGLFGDTMGDLWGNTFNPNALTTTTYKWTGPCVVTKYNNVSYNNTSCDISPAYLATLNPGSPNFTSASGGLNELNNPKLRQNKTYEYTVRAERQIIPNVVVSAGYVHHRVYNLYNSGESTTQSTANGINILRPYSVYTVPVTLPDVLTGTAQTLYTYPSAYAGSVFNQLQLVNAPGDRSDTFHTFEVAVAKRYSKKWNGQGSFWMTKNHEWIQAIRPTPNDDLFPIDNTWNWEARGSGTYNLPWGFEVSGFYRAQSGLPGQRTESFSSPLLLQGNVTLRMEPFGTQRGSLIEIVNIKAAKTISLGESRRLQFSLQVFNLFNNSAATSTSYLTGATYLHPTGILSPRVGRVGIHFSF